MESDRNLFKKNEELFRGGGKGYDSGMNMMNGDIMVAGKASPLLLLPSGPARAHALLHHPQAYTSLSHAFPQTHFHFLPKIFELSSNSFYLLPTVSSPLFTIYIYINTYTLLLTRMYTPQDHLT